MNIKKILYSKFFALLFFPLAALGLKPDGSFTFTLTKSTHTSAGVFTISGTLVKTLWSDIVYPAGTYTKYWDGTDDYGKVIALPDANYNIRVLTNNVTYTWEGTIGNSSTNMTGNSKHGGYYKTMTALAFAGNGYGYFATGYSEGAPSVAKFLITRPQEKINFSANYDKGMIIDLNTDFVATDDIYVYWGGSDAYAHSHKKGQYNSMVYATRTSDDGRVDFGGSNPYKMAIGVVKFNAISIVSDTAANTYITGLAVQKSGSNLFVARAGINQLQVLNKKTGTLLQTLTYNSPRGLSVDGNGSLWMITGTNNVAKYSVNPDGTLSSPTLTLKGLVEPLSTQVSPNGATVSVADAAITSQQIKFFNNTTGNATNVLGTAGGYASDATVNDNKFYLNDVNGVGTIGKNNKASFIAYQPDGSFWVNDPGNFRVQHFNAQRAFIDRIMSLGANYSVYVDKNNIKRVFSGYLEFEIDYSQSLTGSTGWILKKNWGANASTTIYSVRGPSYINTLNNGRTYSLLSKGNVYELVEFGQNNKLRFSGNFTKDHAAVLCSDGSLQEYTLSGGTPVNRTATYTRYPLTGFDGAGNPAWNSTGEILATATTDGIIGNPVATPNTQIFTTTNKVVFYNYKAVANNMGPVFSTGYHLGVMQRGANNTYLFETEKSTPRNYRGPYPKPGWFDVGNGVSDYAGANVNIIERNIITSYHGEFWKGSQTNKYNHYLDDGLAIGQFGITGPETNGEHAFPGMAGNALTPNVVKDVHGDLYLYHGDESDHAALHRWKITGLNTIQEKSLTVPFPSGFNKPTYNYIDLMEGLPYNTTLANNTYGWTRNPKLDTTKDIHAFNWTVVTNVYKYERSEPVDLYINFIQPAPATYSVSRDLGNKTVNKQWRISGNINFGNMLNGLGSNAFVEVLDVNNKLLATLYAQGYSPPARIFGNTVAVPATSISNGVANMNNPFEIEVKDGAVNFTFAGFSFAPTTISDAAGDWRKPRTLRLRFTSTKGLPNYPVSFDISDLRLYIDKGK